MLLTPIVIKPITDKEDVEYFWKQAESSGKPSKETVGMLKRFVLQKKISDKNKAK